MPRRTNPATIFLMLTFLTAALLWYGGGISDTPLPGGFLSIAGDTIPEGAAPAGVIAFLDEGRSWRAARAMRDYLAREADPVPEAFLVAARAEAGWGGWPGVLEQLEGRPWLDELSGGEGLYWLARALDEVGRDEEAERAYARYLEIAGDEDGARSLVAELRLALILVARDPSGTGRVALERVRSRSPAIGDWIDVLVAEAVAPSGDTAVVAAAARSLPESVGMRHRGDLALVAAYEAAGDPSGAVRVALAARDRAGTAARRAEFAYEAGRLSLDVDDVATARRELRTAIESSPGSAAARRGADLLIDLPDLSWSDRLAIADVDARHGNRGRAADGYREWLASAGAGEGERNAVRLRLGRTLFEAGQSTAAESVLRDLFGAAPNVARQAMMLVGRSQYGRGRTDEAFATFELLADRFPGSTEGSEGLFLVADLSHDAEDLERAAAVYRRVADAFPGSDRAGLSLMRLGGMRYLAGDPLGAAAVWEEYRSSYPTGRRWLEATYWAARSYEAAGEPDRARPLYDAIRSRDPLSYYAVRAAERMGVAYWPVPMGVSPPVDPAAEARVAEWILAVDLLRDAGLHDEADAEAQRLAARAGSDVAAAYSLAEALNERGYSIRGIAIGQRLQSSGEPLNPRLLRILYPFPFRDLIEAEAVEKGIDPFVVAALARQESLFTARISSPAGARGLMQVMPQTGATIARSIGIDGWSADLLFNPEVNAHLGTLFLSEQMERYAASLPSVFAAYNAGPHRVEAWKALPEYGDEELFTERIPYRETRDYVKILTRNIELYRGLYEEAGDADTRD